MKHNVILILLGFILAANLPAQDSSKVKLGLGFTLVDFRDLGNTFFSYHYFSPNFLVPVILFEKVRIEPSIGYYNRFMKFEYPNEDHFYQLEDKNLHLGIGLFYLLKQKKFAYYLGTYYTYIFSEEVNKDEDGDEPTKGDGFALGPAFGTEYFFNPHFSLGGEVRFQYLNIDRVEKNKDGEKTRDIFYHSFITRAIIMLRFYF